MALPLAADSPCMTTPPRPTLLDSLQPGMVATLMRLALSGHQPETLLIPPTPTKTMRMEQTDPEELGPGLLLTPMKPPGRDMPPTESNVAFVTTIIICN